MKPAEARKIIRERARNSAHIVILSHARRQMTARDIDDLDVQRVLTGGAITEGPYRPTDRPELWRCNVRGCIAGDRIEVVVDIPPEPPLLYVITAMALGR